MKDKFSFGMTVSPLLLKPETYGNLLVTNNLMFYLLFMGAVLIISGPVVFAGYLRQNPRPAEVQNGQ